MDQYAGRQRGCRSLTTAQRELAKRLAARAEALRLGAGRDGGEGLSVVDAVALAAVQLGLQPSTSGLQGLPSHAMAGSQPAQAARAGRVRENEGGGYASAAHHGDNAPPRA
ncbi:hypothetical protein ABT272_37420 [Streptomyces sp900105245]|uniref:Uncharacterized protein n=1 Tax=Streptomyces sp. 900105245 TaxID=3154379 RepID=A0ABV1UI19_9ACTN